MILLQLDPITGKATISGLTPEGIGAVSITQLKILVAEIAEIKEQLAALKQGNPIEEKPAEDIPGWMETTAGWPGEVRGTFGEERLRKVLARIDNNNGNITMHFVNGSMLTVDGWYGFSEEQIVAYIGI